MRKSSRTEGPDPDLEAAVVRVREADLMDGNAEAKAAFHLRMRARGIQDLAVLRAFELVPRRIFVPHRYLDLANRDLPLPIGCGQTLNAPWLVAQMVEALRPAREHRVLEVGSGSGYATAVLAHLCAEVLGVERFQSLALAAQARLADLALRNAAVVWADGLDLPADIGAFDRIIVHGCLTEPTAAFVERLTADGIMVCARPTIPSTNYRQALVRLIRDADGVAEAVFGECRLQAMQPGLAAAL